MTTKEHKKEKKASARSRAVLTAIFSWISLILTFALLICMLPNLGVGSRNAAVRISVPDIPKALDRQMAAQGSLLPLDSVEEVPPARVIRKLDDGDMIAPKPDPAAYGTAETAADLDWLTAKAAPLLEGQSLYFGQERELLPGSQIRYYLDDSIAVITWKELVGITVLTFAEVKIADGSQFRRFLAGGQFGADTQFKTTEMAQSVNAVLASSGDFYKFRYNGVVVYDKTVRRVNTNKADTCYIDENGDLLFTYQNTTMTQEEAQQFVDDNHIRFSLTFGPVLVDNGVRCEPQNYDLGEVNSFSPRAALCQLDSLHYLVITSNAEEDYPGALTMHQFAERIDQIGCQKAYALDGGQTAAIALDGELVNHVLFGQQRPISDIIYFATAIPEGG